MKMMKKLLLAFAPALFLSLNLLAQSPFWSEDFGTGCNQGQLVTAYSSLNGSWTVSSTGTNAATSNMWYVSSMERNTGEGNCGISGCASNQTLHVGNQLVSGIAADQGAAYYEGLDGFCGFFPCGSTSKRVESPVIDCSGQTSIEMNFLYIEGGNTIDNATVWYYNGSAWSLLQNTPKTSTGCAPQGTWTARTIALPASAENNPGVKIGFQWINNDDADATDPSFAVDDIVLSGIADTGSPTAICQDITLPLSPLGDLVLNPLDIDNGSSDDVGITSFSLDIDTFSCFDIGENAVVLTVSDIDGNFDTCTATVTVVDSTDPLAICQNIEVELDEFGNAVISAAMLDGGSTDNCGIASLDIDITEFTEGDLGLNVVILTVTDASGNSDSCGAIVTIVEYTAPCPYDLNNDGIVNTGDLNVLLSGFGTTSVLGDFNMDGIVNSGDLNSFLAAYGGPC